MKTNSLLIYLFFLLAPLGVYAQYEFSGYVDTEYSEAAIYLSVVEDYRKISGVYPEQILKQTAADSSGYFSFNGNNLPTENKMYRIHIDTCRDEDKNTNHFTGHCPNSKEIVFVASNSTIMSLPSSFENEMFCKVVSENEKTKTFLKIDSLKNDMRFAFGTYRSTANRQINSKKWFSILQQYGEQLQEPLAELYSYAFLSDRSSDLYGYYLDDLKNNEYYEGLLARLQEKYPNSPYTEQYTAELKADQYLIQKKAANNLPWWAYLGSLVAIVSLIGNFYFFRKYQKIRNKENATERLSNQEQKVLDLILINKSNKEIASDMFVSVSTVKTHINNLYKKLKVSSRDEVKKLYS